jgi:FkbM family methyltransferase
MMFKYIKAILRTNRIARSGREKYLGLKMSSDSAAKRFAEVCNSENITTVFDVGANVGQFSKDLRRHGYTGEIYSFEPVNDVYLKLASNFKNDSRWHGIQKGLGRTSGSLQINVSANSGLSTSFLEMGTHHLKNFPDSGYIRNETAEVSSLFDEISQLKINPNNLAVKIDVQGFELEVLEGAGSQLKNIKCLLIEASLVPLYVGEPTLSVLVKFFEANNHRVIDVYRGVKSTTGELLQIDIISEKYSE